MGVRYRYQSTRYPMHAPTKRPFSIVGGRTLTPFGLEPDVTLTVADGTIVGLGDRPEPTTWNAGGLLVLPGIVDIHGDAFERQLMPRPGVHFDARLALFDTDRQLVGNGITTAFHALTYSWEPGLRGPEAGRAFMAALEASRNELSCDTRLHLRWETFNLDVEAEVADWLLKGQVGLLAFNDHTPAMARKLGHAQSMQRYAERTGLDSVAFQALLEQVVSRGTGVQPAIERLAEIARAKHIPMASHDDDSPDIRRWYASLGCAISEFPTNEPTARVAQEAGCDIIMGAPNVVRGGSHIALVAAADMVAKNLCTILSSDYYYPALLHAALRLVRDRVCPLPIAWRLVSENPARAAGLHDRGVLAAGRRADIVVVDDRRAGMPRVVATFIAGRPVFFESETPRLVA
jgi:alpha-D-ribose 1-methylphosphonate 5-triphosphate diphosphatase